ncbi:hypothetical protein ABT023_12845 [Micromonospora sp. NPDC002296]
MPHARRDSHYRPVGEVLSYSSDDYDTENNGVNYDTTSTAQFVIPE